LAALKEREEQTDAKAHEFCDKLAKELADVKKSLGKIASTSRSIRWMRNLREIPRDKEALEEYSDWRAKHIAHLKEMPLPSLVSDEKLKELGFPAPSEGRELFDFMKSEPELAEKFSRGAYRDGLLP